MFSRGADLPACLVEQSYVDEGAEAYEKRYQERHIGSLAAAAQDLGYQPTPKATEA